MVQQIVKFFPDFLLFEYQRVVLEILGVFASVGHVLTDETIIGWQGVVLAAVHDPCGVV